MANKIDGLQGLMQITPSAVTMKKQPQAELREYGPSGGALFTVDATGLGISLLEWTRANQASLEAAYRTHGMILFRGFEVGEASLGSLVQQWSGAVLDYTEPSTPRTKVRDKIYTSTEYPQDQSIPLHNEQSYSSRWPRRIWFYCDEPPAQSGETPIADSHAVYERINPAVRETFLKKQVLYVRNYREDLDLKWQAVFQTEDRGEVEAYCRRNEMEWRWGPDSTLQTRTRRPAAMAHPDTGEMLWFNQAHLFHVSNLPQPVREYLLANYAEMDLPRNAFYGDGTPIEADALDEVRRVYREATVTFPWQRHDLLMLDNMKFAHGRNPFKGNRRILVAMADPMTMLDAGAQARRQTSTFFITRQQDDSPQRLKYKLAALIRILAMEGLEEGISGHISVRVPGTPDRFWVNPFGLTFEEVTPENILMVDHDANVIEGAHPVNVAGFCIHAAIHKARPDVQCVAHTHSPWGAAFSSLGRRIEPLDQNCCMFFEEHELLDEYHGPINDAAEAARLHNLLATASTLILQNHGTITLGQDVESAGVRMLAAERAYRLHLRVLHTKAVPIPAEVARTTREWIANPIGLKIEFDAYLRKAERHYPDLLRFRPE